MLPLIFDLLSVLVNLVLTVLIVNVVLSWLINFDVVDRRNALINTVWTFTSQVTEPMLRPIRALVRPVAGLDLAPLILALGLTFGFQIVRFLVLGY